MWLFGDTFVAEATRENGDRPDDRVGAAFIHNSIGLSRCDGTDFEITYHWGHDRDGTPVAFVDSGEPSPYWWLFDGFVYGGALYLGLLDVAHAPPDGALGMPFALEGMSLARIDDPSAPPSAWRPQVMRLSTSKDAFPGSAMVVHGDHVLLFSFTSIHTGRQARFLARLPLAALDPTPGDLGPHLETLTAEGHWTPGFLPERARILMPDNATEMSVARHPELPPERRWLAVYGSPLQVAESGGGAPTRSGAIYARTAPAPEGPWSERVLLHEIEEVGLGGRGGRPGTICYAAKEHPAFAAPGKLLITYVCNLTSPDGSDGVAVLRRLQRDMRIYVPRVLEVDIPEELLAPPVRASRPAPATTISDPADAAR